MSYKGIGQSVIPLLSYQLATGEKASHLFL